MPVTFPNPDLVEVHFAHLHEGGHIGDIYEAARAAGVKPVTIRVWVTRGKIEPLVHGDGRDLFHIPTVVKASKSRPGRRWPARDETSQIITPGATPPVLPPADGNTTVAA